MSGELKARLLLLKDGRVVVPAEYQGSSYICLVLHPRSEYNTIIQTVDLLEAGEIEV